MGTGCRGVSPEALAAFLPGLSCFSFFLWVSLSSLRRLHGAGKAPAPRDSPGSLKGLCSHWGCIWTLRVGTHNIPALHILPSLPAGFWKRARWFCVPAVPGLCHDAGCGGGGSHPEIAFSRVSVASAACADGRWERGLLLSLQAATNLHLRTKPSATVCFWFYFGTSSKPFVAFLLNALNPGSRLRSSHKLPLCNRIVFSCYLLVTFPCLTCRWSPPTHHICPFASKGEIPQNLGKKQQLSSCQGTHAWSDPEQFLTRPRMPRLGLHWLIYYSFSQLAACLVFLLLWAMISNAKEE